MMSYFATAALAAACMLAASPEAPKWQSSYGDALKATKESEQPLLVVIDKPNLESARVEPALLSERTSMDSLQKYQLCHVDATSEYGKKVAEVFHATTFPHVAIIDKSGSVILTRRTGKIDAKSWEKLLQEHQNGVRTVSHVSYRPASEAVIYEGYEGTGSFTSRPYCPSCQARQF